MSKAPARWPEVLTVAGGVEATIGKRAIAMSPEDILECDDDTLLNPQTVIGSLDADVVSWSIGPVAAKAERAPCTATEAAQAVSAGAGLFMRRGHNYRLYAVKGSAQPAALSVASLDAAAATSSSAAGSPTKSGGGDVTPSKQLNHPSDGASNESSPQADAVQGSEENSPDAGAGGEGRGGRSRKQYTKAVAFEFINGVLGNVLGAEGADEAWA